MIVLFAECRCLLGIGATRHLAAPSIHEVIVKKARLAAATAISLLTLARGGRAIRRPPFLDF